MKLIRQIMFSPGQVLQSKALSVIRMLCGLLLFFHGWEIFDEEVMNTYLGWPVFSQFVAPWIVVYFGKFLELIAGAFISIGLLTRFACLVVIMVMLFIAFVIGKGEIWYADQHPFLFVLLALVFFFNGPGEWSLDNRLFKK